MDEKKAAQVKKMEAESEALMQAIRAELDIQKKQKLIARREKLQRKATAIRNNRKISREAKRDLVAYSFIAPNFIGFAVFTLIPIVLSSCKSFF